MTRANRRRCLRFFLIALLLFLSPHGHPAFADEANVFVYHRFNDSRYPSTNITSQDFTAHLELLKTEQVDVLTLGRVIDKLKAGESLPARCAVITIDDAYRSFLSDGWPILKHATEI